MRHRPNQAPDMSIKIKTGLVVGVGIGTALYQTIHYSLTEVDWYRVALIMLFMTMVSLVLPRRWFDKKKGG
jgi:hypothetical protein